MKICIIGTGYVGLVAGACFSDVGNKVICVDNDTNKIKNLNKGQIDIFEPGLSELVIKNLKCNRLAFTTDICSSVKNSDVCFITVGTPKKENGDADLSMVFAVAKSIGKSMNKYKVIINKSTAPVGTTYEIKKIIKKYTKIKFDIASNPEFLKQGSAVEDFMHPDRTIIGIENNNPKHLLMDLYAPFFRIRNRIMFMDVCSSEMCKYASNAFLATKISFINEIANLCELYGANINNVRTGMSADERIGGRFLFPGIGYGGSCFPKDIEALIKMGKHKCYNAALIKATEQVNNNQIYLFIDKIKRRFKNNLKNKKIAIWGLAFKPKTNDVRDAPSIRVIDELLSMSASISCYDPEAMNGIKKIFGNKINYCKNSRETLINANALVILTEWNEFRLFDYNEAGKLMSNRIIFDGRNQFDVEKMRNNKFEYYCIGYKL